MSSQRLQTTWIGLTLTAGAVLLSLWFPSITFADSATVHNSVSVSSSGTGDSHASVKTVIDGNVVEDITINEPGTIESSTVIDGNTVHIIASNTITTDNEERNRVLLTLIEKLKELIEHYVLLLNTIS